MPPDLPVGIHDLSFATSSLVLTHTELSKHTGANVAKYHTGIGQKAMSVPAADEDIVTMAADAAAPVITRHGTGRIRTLLFATETSIDQSKAAGVYLHSLLRLPSAIRVVELKQACYSGTAALQFAAALVARNPEEQVLVLASDIASYDLDSPGEATQGAAAVAMLVSAKPALVELCPATGLHTDDIADFWRPNYRSTAVVDGKKSAAAYLAAVDGAWRDYQARGGLPLEQLRTVCYHQPFTRMAFKAHQQLTNAAGIKSSNKAIESTIAPTTRYNETIGNSYTASLYLALAAVLDGNDTLGEETIGFFSYGSGSVAEFFAGRVVPGYGDRLRTRAHRETIARRRPIDYAAYLKLREHPLPHDGGMHLIPRQTQGNFRLCGISNHQRLYEVVGPLSA
ncbi:hydroxymethylglutaryl-CoA synthase [Streptomyces ficellus]|uniref:Hydroxymethylglutaryl-CoA synthase n=1 Tax=Streptomyces ficellus TaxID=1977088 RepID=A0ABT7Z5X0_9ACTN|nr:hydroxymethylglutaryl-CoA synthase [Streptomyces ficellus]MDN3294888.1 hydroxymethylglutaryl-CoA synthase [Streptomyces ficellus]